MFELLTWVGIGIGVGTVGGALGIGGGFLLVPILFTYKGWPLIPAIATSHICSLAVSLSATARYASRGLVDWRRGILLEAAVVVGAAAGARLALGMPASIMGILFAGIAIIASLRMWFPPADHEVGAEAVPTAGRTGLAAGLLSLVGVVAAALGLGGGVLKVPILSGILHLPTRRAVGTSAMMVGITSATAGSVYFPRVFGADGPMHGILGPLPELAVLCLVTGVFFGALLGSVVQRHVPVAALRRTFAVLLLLLAYRIVRRTLGL